jgi:hypothetical protein
MSSPTENSGEVWNRYFLGDHKVLSKEDTTANCSLSSKIHTNDLIELMLFQYILYYISYQRGIFPGQDNGWTFYYQLGGRVVSLSFVVKNISKKH